MSFPPIRNGRSRRVTSARARMLPRGVEMRAPFGFWENLVGYAEAQEIGCRDFHRLCGLGSF